MASRIVEIGNVCNLEKIAGLSEEFWVPFDPESPMVLCIEGEGDPVYIRVSEKTVPEAGSTSEQEPRCSDVCHVNYSGFRIFRDTPKICLSRPAILNRWPVMGAISR